MKITMDRYEANWEMVSLGWKTHVLGEGRQFENAEEAIETLRKRDGSHRPRSASVYNSEKRCPCRNDRGR